MSITDPPPRSSGVGTVYTPNVAVASTGTLVIAQGYGALLGWHVADTVGSQVNVRFWDGASPGAANSQQLTTIVTVGPSSSSLGWLGPQGVAIGSQVCLERISGKSEVIVYGQ